MFTNTRSNCAVPVTQRHLFAMAALEGLLAASIDHSYLASNCDRKSFNQKLCKCAIEIADEMLQQLEEGKQ